jgi:hypothetical protein
LSNYQRRKSSLNNNSNNDHTPPKENVASNLAPISSRDTRSSLHNTRSASTRDITTTKLVSSLLELTYSKLPIALNQTTSNTRNSWPTRELRTTSHDPLDRRKLNPFQDNRINFESKPRAGVSKYTMRLSRSISYSISISMFNLSYTTLLMSSESRSIISGSHFPEYNRKMPPLPFPKGATSANYPKSNNHPVVTMIMNSTREVISCQNTPSTLNTYPLSPQIAASDKSRATNISLESPLALTTPTYSPILRQVTVATSTLRRPTHILHQGSSLREPDSGGSSGGAQTPNQLQSSASCWTNQHQATQKFRTTTPHEQRCSRTLPGQRCFTIPPGSRHITTLPGRKNTTAKFLNNNKDRSDRNYKEFPNRT